MYFIRKNGSTSNILRVKLRRSDTGQGLTGLDTSSTGLIISTICDNELAATTYSVAGGTIETITNNATYAAPTITKCRFKVVDATNHPGLYEIQLADARFAVSGAKVLRITISGAANLLEKESVVQLTSVDVDSAAAFITGINSLAPPTNWNLHAIDASGRVTPINIDGITYASAMEILLAVLAGVATPNGSTTSFMKRDGTTVKLTITHGGLAGKRTQSTIIS